MRTGIALGAPVPLSGRYAAQGAQMRAGLEAWAGLAGARVVLEDDGSDPARAASVYRKLHGRCDLVLAPYGSDSVRAAAAAGCPPPLWNHGGAADDVQRRPGAVSLPTPASRYLVALGRAVARLRPGAGVALATARGGFGRFAREGLEREAPALGLTLTGTFPLAGPPEPLLASRPDAVLLCGPVEQELALLWRLRGCVPLLAGVSPGLRDFPALLGADPDGLLAPVQWHPALRAEPRLGPGRAEALAAFESVGWRAPDYVAAQAFACALLAAHCLATSPADPQAAAQRLSTTTFYGAFELDPESGLQRAHRLCVVRWKGGEQELLLEDAA